MKILKIEFRNINSLRGDHEIDFTAAPFSASSLFAITGPTGSGKSSVLDVISLALFNQVPRIPGGRTISKNDILKFGAILTRNQKDAMARVTYECNSGKYSSEWSIATNRNDKLRDHEMEIIDLETGSLLDLKKSDVPGKNEELIGLSYDQFIKSVLLAQGEFAQFLKVNKKERGALLEKITGTGIYRKLGMRAYEKYSELNKEIEKQQHEIQIIGERLLTDERKAQLATEIISQNQQLENYSKTCADLSKNIELKNTITHQQKEISSLAELQNKSKITLSGFLEEFGKSLNEHEKVHFFGEDLRNWSTTQDLALELKQESNKIKEQLEKNLTSKKLISQQLEKLINKPVTEDAFEILLEDFKSNILKLQEERKEKESTYLLLKQSFDAAVRPLNYTPSKEIDVNRTNLLSLKLTSEKTIKELKDTLEGLDLTSLDTERSKLKKRLGHCRIAEKQHYNIQNSEAELQKIISEKMLLIPNLELLPRQIKSLEEELKLNNSTLANFNLEKENQLLKASLEELRQKLIINEPCPLCGSLEHPFAAHLPKSTNDLDLKIADLKSEIETKNNKLATYKVNLDTQKIQIQNLEKREKTLLSELELLNKNFKEQFEYLEAQQDLTWESRVKVLEDQIDVLEKYEKENSSIKAIEEALPIIDQLKAIIEEGQEIATKIKAIYQGEDIVKEAREYHTRFTRSQQEQLSLKEQITKLEDKELKNQEHLLMLEQKLKPLVEKSGIKSISLAREALLPDHKFLEIRNRHEALKSEIDKTATSLKLLKEQLQLNLEKEPEDTLEELNLVLETTQGKQKELQLENQEFNRQLKNHQENLDHQNQLKSNIADREKQTLRWRLLNTIIGDRTGNKFNEFAQDLTLSQLLQLANVSLRELSDRYLIDKPEEEEDDGLVAIDEHMGGQRRSVKTLSGGETFILSLSMALALSDLASKNVEINSLFIDEGFGTLDPETLDLTLDTLERLQAESSKTIGIISHVDSLKERINTQVKLTRNGQGYSSLEVVG